MDTAACERLAASLNLQNAKVTLAQPVTSRQFVPPTAPGASAPPATSSAGLRDAALADDAFK
jgi:hypothetical protein